MSALKTTHIDDLMAAATEALEQMRYFDAERCCIKALVAARRGRDYERLARICMPLQEARRQRLDQAFDAGREHGLMIVEEPFEADVIIEPGCYIVDPMLVAADARRLRISAFEQDVPVAVLCREPVTSSGLQPIAALGEVVVRTKIKPADDWDAPTLEWFIEALEALGDAAIESIDPALAGERRVDALLDRLDAVPDHEKLHQRLAEAAHDVAHALAAE